MYIVIGYRPIGTVQLEEKKRGLVTKNHINIYIAISKLSKRRHIIKLLFRLLWKTVKKHLNIYITAKKIKQQLNLVEST